MHFSLLPIFAPHQLLQSFSSPLTSDTPYPTRSILRLYLMHLLPLPRHSFHTWRTFSHSLSTHFLYTWHTFSTPFTLFAPFHTPFPLLSHLMHFSYSFPTFSTPDIPFPTLFPLLLHLTHLFILLFHSSHLTHYSHSLHTPHTLSPFFPIPFSPVAPFPVSPVGASSSVPAKSHRLPRAWLSYLALLPSLPPSVPCAALCLSVWLSLAPLRLVKGKGRCEQLSWCVSAA